MGCQQKVEYTYITGGGRSANGKQDPDEFGVDAVVLVVDLVKTCVI